MDTFETLKKILVETFNKESESIQLNVTLKNDMEMDSLEFVEVMMEIEEEFGITIDDAVAEKFETLQDVVNYIESNK